MARACDLVVWIDDDLQVLRPSHLRRPHKGQRRDCTCRRRIVFGLGDGRGATGGWDAVQQLSTQIRAAQLSNSNLSFSHWLP